MYTMWSLSSSDWATNLSWFTRIHVLSLLLMLASPTLLFCTFRIFASVAAVLMLAVCAFHSSGEGSLLCVLLAVHSGLSVEEGKRHSPCSVWQTHLPCLCCYVRLEKNLSPLSAGSFFFVQKRSFGWPWIGPRSVSTKSDCGTLVSTVIHAEEATLQHLKCVDRLFCLGQVSCTRW